jgi:hypothetical protein
VFVKYGWRAGAALGLGWYGLQVVILLVRGPHCKRSTWVGYEGGVEARKSVVEVRKREIESSTTIQSSAAEEKDLESASNILDQNSSLEVKNTLEKDNSSSVSTCLWKRFRDEL